MATWCLQTGLGPEHYRSLTRLERRVFFNTAREIANRRR